jgi:peptide chain release factor subunit 1
MTSTNSVSQHKLRKLIARLSNKEGRGKEFISLYLPGQLSTQKLIASLRNDSDSLTAESGVNDRFQVALKNVLQRVRAQKEISANGLAIFAGTFAGNELDSEVLNVEEVIPPQPVTSYIFKVDDHFWLDPLREMVRDQRVVGLIAMDSKEANFGVYSSERLEFLDNITSGIPGKTGKGGQSQRRYERERDMEITYFFHRIAEHAAKAFLENREVTVLMVGGPGQTKNDFLKGDYLHYELKNSLLNVVDTQSAGKEGVREIFAKSSEVLMHMCGPEEKQSMQRLTAELNKQNGLAICGLDAVLEGLKSGTVEVALVTDKTDLVEIDAKCKNCGTPKSKILNKRNVQDLQAMLSTPCEKCHAVEYEVVEKDMIDVLEDAASGTNARIEVIFTESEEKAKLSALGGFAAVLRYKPI